ncbi:MAG: hypothetical protein U9Q80_08555 [Bacillota bacterium]|nr:hypothetical protein [Bacillota bacterium]
MIPDVRSLPIDEARRKIYEYDKSISIIIAETLNRRDIEHFDYKISETMVIAQRMVGKEVNLIVAYTTLQL